MNLTNPGRITKVIFWLLGLILFGWSAAVMAANPTIAVYQDTTFDKASDFNYSNTWFENADAPDPLPGNRISEANGNVAYVSLSAEPGSSGQAFAQIGVQFDWDLGSYTWEEISNRELTVTINFDYELSAYYLDGSGSANTSVFFNTMSIYDIYDSIGHQAGTTGTHSGTGSETFSTTFGQMQDIIWAEVKCQAQNNTTSNYDTWSSSKLTINSITIHPDSDYSKYDFTYYYNDDSGDYYTGYVYAPTSFKITNDADNHGFIQVGTHLTNEPAELGGGALGGYYDITSITDGYGSSYDKKEYITSYYDADTNSGQTITKFWDSSGSAVEQLSVLDRTKEAEQGYINDPAMVSDIDYEVNTGNKDADRWNSSTQAWENSSIFYKYHIGFVNNSLFDTATEADYGAALKVYEYIYLTGVDPGTTLKNTWENTIEEVWNDQFNIKDGDFKYPIEFDVRWGDASNYDPRRWR